MSGRKTRRPGEIAIPPGSGVRQGPHLYLLAEARRLLSVHPADLRLALPGLPHPRRPFYSRDDLRYLEHGAGPLAAELERLWRAKGAGKRHTVRAAAGHDGDGWPALPRGAAGLARRRPQVRTVTDLYYPGLGRAGGRNAGSR